MHRSTVLIKFAFGKLGKKEYMYLVIGLLYQCRIQTLRIKSGGGGGRLVSKKTFSALQFGLKIRGALPWIRH